MMVKGRIETGAGNRLFVGCDGELFDTDPVGWHKLPPLRRNYAKHFRSIENTQQFKSCLRAGAYAWPGGYELYFITSDGAALCYSCALKEFRSIIQSIGGKSRDGWWIQFLACTDSYDDPVVDLTCDHCNVVIAEGWDKDNPNRDQETGELKEEK